MPITGIVVFISNAISNTSLKLFNRMTREEVMRQAVHKLVIVSFWLLILKTAAYTAPTPQEPAKPEPPPAQLERTIVPAAGAQKTVLNVTRFGKYSILASSKQGTALQLIDRMAGPGEIHGKIGEQDGRLDAILERGQYLVVSHGHKLAKGTAKIELRPFTELNMPQPPQLIEQKLIENQLHDFEQLSYWLEIKQRQFVTLEAAGRSLSDLRLWKDGNWLMDIQPSTQKITPRQGQPLFSCRMNVELDKGLYLLTAYGGPSQPWAEESKYHPLYIRQGIPHLGIAGKRRFVVSPFGQDRYIVPGQATYFRMELPEARPALMHVDWFNQNHLFDLFGVMKEITKKSIPPVVEITTSGNEQQNHIVTVTAEAGQPYILQQFEIKYTYDFEGNRDYWISTIHSGYTADSVDATAILSSHLRAAPSRPELSYAQTIEIGSDQYWHRRVNLLSQTTLFMHVKTTGTYQLACQGIEARYQVEPFFVNRPYAYQTPASKPCGANWDLDAGYYVLSITPLRAGIADLLMRPMGMLDSILNTVGWGKTIPITPSRGATRFNRVPLTQNRNYTLYVNQQPEVEAGMILRPLPVDPTDPLYIVQEPGEVLSVPFQSKEPGILRAEAENGTFLEMSIDGVQWTTTMPVDTAAHTISIRHSQKEAVQYTLAVMPRRLDAQTPLPPLSQEALAGLPKFPIIDENTRQFGDLEKVQSATYLLKADKPALYQLQSTGLLATAGNLRSRTNPSFVRKSQNGVGRNFSLQQYLREGDYQFTVESEGESAGHYGLELARTAIRNGGFLTSKIPARATLEPGQAIAYYFIITDPGNFRLRALGEGRTFHCRLEDKDGWPVLPPDIEADVNRYFSRGQYRLVILPEVTTARVIAQIEPESKQLKRKGHGPHVLKLADTAEHIWMEPEENNPRTPDTWEFTLPAPIEARIDLSDGMIGTLMQLDESGKIAIKTDKVVPGRFSNRQLAMGRYRLEVTAIRKNNHAPYHIAILPTEITAGMSRVVSAPASIPLSVGKTGLVEINSFGSDDVQAQLYDKDEKLVEENDDRPDDWNFLIAHVLTPGRYRLEVKPAGKAEASTTVSMLTPSEELQGTLTLPAQLNPVLKRAVKLYPLPPVTSPAMLTAAVDSNENVGLAIEELRGDIWQVLASRNDRSPVIRIPLGDVDEKPQPAYRLRLWSLDRREIKIGLRVESIVPQAATEAQLQMGISLPAANPDSPAPVYLIKLDHPGMFQVDDTKNQCWSPGFREACRPVQSNLVAAWQSELWISSATLQTPAAMQSIRARRIELSSKTSSPLQFPMRDKDRIFTDLAPNGSNPILVLASSQEGQPAIKLIERDGRQAPFLNNIAIASRGAVSVLLSSRAPAAGTWAATPESTGIDVRLTPYYFPAIESLPSANTIDGKIEGTCASGLTLNPGSKRLHLALGNATVAVLSKGAEIESVHWQGGNPFNITIDSTADRLLLLHTRQEEDRYAVEMIPIRVEESLPPLTIGIPYEKNHLRSGIEIITVPAVSDGIASSIHIRGTVVSTTFFGNNGRAIHGNDFAAPSGGGILEIVHEQGLLLCWMDQAGKEAKGLWPSTPDTAKAEVLSLPASRNLKTSSEAFQIKTPAPVLLHVRMPAQSISMLKRASEEPEIAVHPGYTLIEAYLPAGTSQFYLRSIGGSPLSGSVEFTASPIISISEGLGPAVLLGPGDSRIFSFEVKLAGPVGIGVRASSDVIEAELLSSKGKSIGKGTVQKFNLDPGIYLLVLRAPTEGAPVRVQPAVVGVVPPSTGPPEDVIRKYLGPETAPPQFTSSHQQTPDESEEYRDESEQEGQEGSIEDVESPEEE
jgi:hypothetical protein